MVSWEYPPVVEGGLGRHVRKLSEQLVLDGHAVRVLTRGERLGGGFDVVHSHDWLVADAARALGRPWVATVHATEHGRHAGRVAQHPQSYVHAAERRMVAEADRVLVCSRYMRRQLVDALGADPARVTVVPNAIDPADLRPVTDLPPGERVALRFRASSARRLRGWRSGC